MRKVGAGINGFGRIERQASRALYAVYGTGVLSRSALRRPCFERRERPAVAYGIGLPPSGTARFPGAESVRPLSANKCFYNAIILKIMSILLTDLAAYRIV